MKLGMLCRVLWIFDYSGEVRLARIPYGDTDIGISRAIIQVPFLLEIHHPSTRPFRPCIAGLFKRHLRLKK